MVGSCAKREQSNSRTRPYQRRCSRTTVAGRMSRAPIPGPRPTVSRCEWELRTGNPKHLSPPLVAPADRHHRGMASSPQIQTTALSPSLNTEWRSQVYRIGRPRVKLHRCRPRPQWQETEVSGSGDQRQSLDWFPTDHSQEPSTHLRRRNTIELVLRSPGCNIPRYICIAIGRKRRWRWNRRTANLKTMVMTAGLTPAVFSSPCLPSCLPKMVFDKKRGPASPASPLFSLV